MHKNWMDWEKSTTCHSFEKVKSLRCFDSVMKVFLKRCFILFLDVATTPDQRAADQDDEFDMFAQSRKSTFDEVRQR